MNTSSFNVAMTSCQPDLRAASCSAPDNRHGSQRKLDQRPPHNNPVPAPRRQGPGQRHAQVRLRAADRSHRGRRGSAAPLLALPERRNRQESQAQHSSAVSPADRRERTARAVRQVRSGSDPRRKSKSPIATGHRGFGTSHLRTPHPTKMRSASFGPTRPRSTPCGRGPRRGR